MMGTITVRSYCLYHPTENKAYVGNTKQEVLAQVCRYWVDVDRIIYIGVFKFEKRAGPKLGREYPTSEYQKEAMNYAWSKIEEYGYRKYVRL